MGRGLSQALGSSTTELSTDDRVSVPHGFEVRRMHPPRPPAPRRHPLGTAAADFIQGEGELLASIVLRDYPEYWRTSFRRRIHAGNSDQ